MVYVSKEWVTGETITADGLNNMEEGIQEALEGGSGRFDINVTMEYQTDHYEVTDFDKTIEEINTAYDEGMVIVAHANAMGTQLMLYLLHIGSSYATFSACDVMGSQAHIYYLSIGSSNSFSWKIIS